jgi:hypothetical protein
VKNLTGTWGGGLKKEWHLKKHQQFEHQTNMDSLLGEEWWFQQEKWIADQQLSGLFNQQKSGVDQEKRHPFLGFARPKKMNMNLVDSPNWWINFNGGKKTHLQQIQDLG